jgi:hypothetical protein
MLIWNSRPHKRDRHPTVEERQRVRESEIRSTGKTCALAKSRGLYVSKKSHVSIEGETAVL